MNEKGQKGIEELRSGKVKRNLIKFINDIL